MVIHLFVLDKCLGTFDINGMVNDVPITLDYMMDIVYIYTTSQYNILC